MSHVVANVSCAIFHGHTCSVKTAKLGQYCILIEAVVVSS